MFSLLGRIQCLAWNIMDPCLHVFLSPQKWKSTDGVSHDSTYCLIDGFADGGMDQSHIFLRNKDKSCGWALFSCPAKAVPVGRMSFRCFILRWFCSQAGIYVTFSDWWKIHLLAVFPHWHSSNWPLGMHVSRWQDCVIVMFSLASSYITLRLVCF